MNGTRARRAMALRYLALAVLALPFLLPLLIMLRESLLGEGWHNYVAILSRPELPLFFRNSAVIAALTVALVYVCVFAAAYALAKLSMRYKEFVYYGLLATLSLPASVLIVPLFVTIEGAGLFNTYWAVALPQAALSIPFMLLLARSFIEGIPDDFVHAAQLDGSSTFAILWRIVVPLAKPISAVVIVWALIGSWNDFLFPLMFLQDPSMQTITLLPQYFQSEFGRDQPKIVAAAVVTTLPTVIAYLALQRWFERGMTAGAMK